MGVYDIAIGQDLLLVGRFSYSLLFPLFEDSRL